MSKKINTGIRILVGLLMIVFGLNKFLNFMPQPEPGAMGAEMVTLATILSASPFMSIIGIIEILGGIALLIGKYVPLALTFLVAVLLNATLFHLFYDTKNVGGALVFLILCLYLVYTQKDKFFGLLSA
jgi:putative oxidoreductase